jgi:hypothetical protein
VGPLPPRHSSHESVGQDRLMSREVLPNDFAADCSNCQSVLSLTTRRPQGRRSAGAIWLPAFRFRFAWPQGSVTSSCDIKIAAHVRRRQGLEAGCFKVAKGARAERNDRHEDGHAVLPDRSPVGEPDVGYTMERKNRAPRVDRLDTKSARPLRRGTGSDDARSSSSGVARPVGFA